MACSAESQDSATVTKDQSAVTADSTTITQDEQSIQVDQLSLQSTQIKNAQAVTSANQAMTTAQQTLANAQVTLQDDEQSVTNDQTTVSDDQGNLGATIEADEATLEAADITLQSAQSNLTGASLTAPVAGTVTEVNVAVGNQATAGSTVIGSTASSSSSSSTSGTGSTTPSYAFEIIGTASFDADASISSADVSEVQVGDQAQLTVSGSAAPVFGTVSSLGIVATVSSGVATFPVTIAVTGTPSGLYSGMTATTSIIVLDRSNVLTVPSSAVHTLGTASFVYELSKGKEVEHTVKVGAIGTTLTQITAGLKSGDKVVLANLAATIPAAGTSTSPFGSGGLGGAGLGGGGGFRITGGGGGGFVGRGGLGAGG
jgi:multidrug efflux pump subunit AcrA (membrane-fusion protein)